MSFRAADTIRSYIVDRYPMARAKGLADDEPLAGILDSLAVLGLVGFLETEFGVELTATDLTDENFETVDTIAQLVLRLSSPVGQRHNDSA